MEPRSRESLTLNDEDNTSELDGEPVSDEESPAGHRDEAPAPDSTEQPEKSVRPKMEIAVKGVKPSVELLPVARKRDAAVAQAFNDDSESEEEMPRECKMKMRNFGRETPTSAGPNSFSKGRQGFSNQLKSWEMKLKTPSSKDNPDA